MAKTRLECAGRARAGRDARRAQRLSWPAWCSPASSASTSPARRSRRPAARGARPAASLGVARRPQARARARSFRHPVAGRIALDVGASTGGFTDCLLQRGAARVYAVDVGHRQLDWKLRTDPRVVVDGADQRPPSRRARMCPSRSTSWCATPASSASRPCCPRRSRSPRPARTGGADQAAVRGRQGPGRQGRHRARSRAA